MIDIRSRRAAYLVAATQIASFRVRTRPSSIVSGAQASVTFCQTRS